VWKWIFRSITFLLLIFLISFIWIYTTLPDISPLKNKNPESTAIIQQRINESASAGKKLKIRQKWIGFSKIPDLLKKSVRISEDAGFYLHEGVDLVELKEAFKKNWEEGTIVRGGSTITQQLAKNLYLSTSRSIFRKIHEFFITRRIEETLSKNRIFHLYLNIIEFGPGIFGVEAASRYYFGKSVSRLTPEEIIRLTAIIPRPLKIRPNGKSKWLLWKSCWISEKLYLYKYISRDLFKRLKQKFC